MYVLVQSGTDKVNFMTFDAEGVSVSTANGSVS